MLSIRTLVLNVTTLDNKFTSISSSQDWDSGEFAPGETYTHTFLSTGIYSFWLLGQPQTSGEITVQARYDYPATQPSQVGNYTTVSKWNKTIITYFFQNGTNDITGNNEQQAVRDAFGFWENVTPLTFIEAANASNADIIVLWASAIMATLIHSMAQIIY